MRCNSSVSVCNRKRSHARARYCGCDYSAIQKIISAFMDLGRIVSSISLQRKLQWKYFRAGYSRLASRLKGLYINFDVKVSFSRCRVVVNLGV